jgi:hypothetical protein
MKPTIYEPVKAHEATPFDDEYSASGDALTFRISDQNGVRYDQAIVIDGMSGEMEWLWPGHIPFGRVTLIQGPAGAGKSFVALDLAARLSADRAWPDGTPQTRSGSKALVLSRQDDASDVVGARLERLGAVPQRCRHFLEFETVDAEDDRFRQRSISLPDDLPVLERLLERDETIRLVVIDSLSSFCKKKKDLPEAINQLNRLITGRNVAIVATLPGECRFKKEGPAVVKTKYDTEAARCGWCCVPDPEEAGRFLLLPTLMNYAALPMGLSYRLGHLKIDWDAEPVDPRKPLRSETECEKWLRELLAEGDLRVVEVKRLGKELGYSSSRIDRAAKTLDVKKQRNAYGKGSAYFWSIGKGIVDKVTRFEEHVIRDFEATGIEQMSDEQAGVHDEQDLKDWDAEHPEYADADHDGQDENCEKHEKDEKHGVHEKHDDQAVAVDPDSVTDRPVQRPALLAARGARPIPAALYAALQDAANAVLGSHTNREKHEKHEKHGVHDEPDGPNAQDDAGWDEEEEEVSWPASDAEIEKIVNGGYELH